MIYNHSSQAASGLPDNGRSLTGSKETQGQSVRHIDMNLRRQSTSYSRLPCRLLYNARCLARSKALSPESSWQPVRGPVPDRLGTKVFYTDVLFSLILFPTAFLKPILLYFIVFYLLLQYVLQGQTSSPRLQVLNFRMVE